MFERFTPRARRVIVLAQDAARDLGHPRISPEHLLIGLRQGEGMAASAMAEAGVDGAALRARVAGLHASSDAAKKIDKVPFSTEAKQCLEQSLRAALALGHNYIGTEHLFFGVQRQAEMNGRSLDDVLCANASEIHRKLNEMLGGSVPSTRSPALRAALERARSQAGQSPMTTGHVLIGMVADPGSQAWHALAAAGVDAQRLRSAVDAVEVADTSDASPAAQSVSITIGETTTVLNDPGIAGALQHLNAEQLREIIKRAVEGVPAKPPADQPQWFAPFTGRSRAIAPASPHVRAEPEDALAVVPGDDKGVHRSTRRPASHSSMLLMAAVAIPVWKEVKA